MSTLILDKVLSGYNLAKVNDNFERIEKAFNEALLHRDGSKELTNDLDVNNQKLLNVRGIEIDGVDITESVNQLREEYTSLIDGLQEYQSILDGILAEAISYGAVDKKSIGNAQTTFTTTQNYAVNATLTLPLPYIVGKNTLSLNMNHYYDMFKGIDYEEVGTIGSQSTTIKLLKPVSTGIVFEQFVDGDNDLYSIYSTAEALQTLLTTSYSPESISAFVDAVSDIEELGLEDKIDQLNTQYEQLVVYSTALQTTVADINTKYSTITDMYEDMGTKYSLLETLYPQLLALLSDTDFDLDDLNSAIGDLNDAIKDINDAMEDIQGYADAASDSATEAAGSASDAADSALEAASYVSTINTSVNNARIWAEGTDTEVATLSGEHSAKEWAKRAGGIAGNVSITATGSTESRALADRFADCVNVKDFGAVGDNSTDDTAAIQAAIDTGKDVYFPCINNEQYKVTSTLETYREGQSFFSDPQANTGILFYTTGTATPLFNVEHQLVRFTNLHIRSNTNGTGIGIYASAPDVVPGKPFVNNTDLTVHECDISNFYVGIDTNGRGPKVYGTVFGEVHDPIKINWTDESTAESSASDTDKILYGNDYGFRGTVINDNVFHVCHGVCINFVSGNPNGAIISGNRFDVGVGRFLVCAGKLQGATITNNALMYSGTTFIESPQIERCSIVGNTFRGTTVQSSGAADRYPTRFILSNTSSKYNTISGNTFECSQLDSIYLQNSYYDTITGNSFLNCAGGSTSSSVQGAIFLRTTAEGTVIDGNTCVLPNEYALFVHVNTSTTLKNVKITDNSVSDESRLLYTPNFSDLGGNEIGNNGLLVTATGSTTARTLANRFADVINVKDFGAVGDGTTDDTQAIQAAFNAGIGKKVIFPTASYVCGRVDIPDGVGCVDFLNSTILKQGYNTHGIVFSGCKNLLLQNVRVINGTNNSRASFLRGLNVSNVVIQNVYLYSNTQYDGVTGTNGLVLSGSDITIDNITIKYDGTEKWADGIHFGVVNRVILSNFDIRTSDDCIAVCPDTAVTGSFVNAQISDINIGNGTCVSANANCFKFGFLVRNSETYNSITLSDILVHDVVCSAQTQNIVNTDLSGADDPTAGGRIQFSNIIASDNDTTADVSAFRWSYPCSELEITESQLSRGSSNTLPLINISDVGSLKISDTTIVDSASSGTLISCSGISSVLLDGNNISSSSSGTLITLGSPTFLRINSSNIHSSVNAFAAISASLGTTAKLYLTNNIITGFARGSNISASNGVAVNCVFGNVFDTSFRDYTDISAVKKIAINTPEILTATGGLMSGTLRFSTANSIRRDDKTSSVIISGGNSFAAGDKAGARLFAFGADSSSNGMFQFNALNATGNKFLIGQPDGTLTWDGQAIQTSSDERLKTPISSVPDDVLDAWGAVNWGQFQYLEAVKEKGETARLHIGLIAQHVKSVFEAQGLDACKYGILCHEENDASYDEEGNEIIPARELWTVRYTEAQGMEAAYQRRRADRIEARLEALEERMR